MCNNKIIITFAESHLSFTTTEQGAAAEEARQQDRKVSGTREDLHLISGRHSDSRLMESAGHGTGAEDRETHLTHH